MCSVGCLKVCLHGPNFPNVKSPQSLCHFNTDFISCYFISYLLLSIDLHSVPISVPCVCLEQYMSVDDRRVQARSDSCNICACGFQSLSKMMTVSASWKKKSRKDPEGIWVSEPAGGEPLFGSWIVSSESTVVNCCQMLSTWIYRKHIFWHFNLKRRFKDCC